MGETYIFQLECPRCGMLEPGEVECDCGRFTDPVEEGGLVNVSSPGPIPVMVDVQGWARETRELEKRVKGLEARVDKLDGGVKDNAQAVFEVDQALEEPCILSEGAYTCDHPSCRLDIEMVNPWRRRDSGEGRE